MNAENTRYCDICGGTYEVREENQEGTNDPNSIMFFYSGHRSHHYSLMDYACCPECMAAIMEVIQTRTENRKLMRKEKINENN